MENIGILLVNLGTPDKPEKTEVANYLAEFLMDPKVIDIPFLARWFLVNGIILRTRPKKSAEAYKKVWTERGSPLLYHSQDLTAGVAKAFGGKARVKLAMRYGNPKLSEGLQDLVEAGVGQIVVVPLYPQYAAATTGSTVAAVFEHLDKSWNIPPVTIIRDFYDHPQFIEAFVSQIRTQLDEFQADHLLFSYHGLPESHLTKTAKICLSEGCCANVKAENRYCYRAQCYATSRCLSTSLDLDTSRWSIAFQSRLGKAEWIKPYTTDQLKVLAERGVKRLAVSCPAFVADCLETIEEIGMEAREDFRSWGGEDLTLIPSLNSSDQWIQSLYGIISDHLPNTES